MKITALTRIRNEEAIIHDTLDHIATFADKTYVFDDASEDNTLKIVEEHNSVAGIIRNQRWENDRLKAETENRRDLLLLAQKNSPDTEWFVYLDADERIEFNWELLRELPKNVSGVMMQLFDFYITPDDVNKRYNERRYIGPEYRNILMVFRNIPGLIYIRPDQRSPLVPGQTIVSGFVKHYGKAISVQQWEDTCDYYSVHFPKYAAKWKERKGKAVHTQSDFGRQLITWDEKEEKGIKLY